MTDTVLAKAHVQGHVRGEFYVRPYDREGGDHPQPVYHPRRGDDGKRVLVTRPHRESSHDTWTNPDAVATFVPDGDAPNSLNGLSLTKWRDHPTTLEGWDYVEGVDDNLEEPAFTPKPGKSIGAGVVIEEPDGRIWLCAPTNAFGGYEATFPKGTAEGDLSLQANALKEAFEETGLKVKITGFIGDFERTTSVARMYKGVRVGGTPTDCGWETQAVHLCPKGLMYEHLNGLYDHPVAEMVGAGPAPKFAE